MTWHEVLFTFPASDKGVAIKARLLAYISEQEVPNVVESYYDGLSTVTTPNEAELSLQTEQDSLPLLIYTSSLSEAVALADQIQSKFGESLDVPRIRPVRTGESENPWTEGNNFTTKRFALRTGEGDVSSDLDRIVIRLLEGEAFGSGRHVTTLAMLTAIEEMGSPFPHRVLDVGTGNGVLLIAAHALGAQYLVGTDLTEEIVTEARINLSTNCVKAELIVSDNIPSGFAPFDLIMANIPIAALRPLLPAMVRCAAPQAAFVFSGFTENDGTHFQRELETFGFSLSASTEFGGWVALRLRRR